MLRLGVSDVHHWYQAILHSFHCYIRTAETVTKCGDGLKAYTNTRCLPTTLVNHDI